MLEYLEQVISTSDFIFSMGQIIPQNQSCEIKFTINTDKISLDHTVFIAGQSENTQTNVKAVSSQIATHLETYITQNKNTLSTFVNTPTNVTAEITANTDATHAIFNLDLKNNLEKFDEAIARRSHYNNRPAPYYFDFILTTTLTIPISEAASFIDFNAPYTIQQDYHHEVFFAGGEITQQKGFRNNSASAIPFPISNNNEFILGELNHTMRKNNPHPSTHLVWFLTECSQPSCSSNQRVPELKPGLFISKQQVINQVLESFKEVAYCQHKSFQAAYAQEYRFFSTKSPIINALLNNPILSVEQQLPLPKGMRKTLKLSAYIGDANTFGMDIQWTMHNSAKKPLPKQSATSVVNFTFGG